MALLSILQLVGVHVGAEGAGHIGGGHLATLGLAQERAQLILQGHGGSEDGGALLLGRTVLTLALRAAAAAAGLLDLLRHALLQAL